MSDVFLIHASCNPSVSFSLKFKPLVLLDFSLWLFFDTFASGMWLNLSVRNAKSQNWHASFFELFTESYVVIKQRKSRSLIFEKKSRWVRRVQKVPKRPQNEVFGVLANM